MEHGQLLLMPSEYGQYAGVKVASVAPDNPKLGRERIQGVYVLMDSSTLTPVALIDGSALTLLRTAAVSLAAASCLVSDSIDHMVVFGAGPQAVAHLEALRSLCSPSRVSIVSRTGAKAQALAESITWTSASVREADCIADAQLIVCATSAREPVFDGRLVRDDCLVIAVGSHEPDVREVDSELIHRSQVIVEDVMTAQRESGDVVIPLREGTIDAHDLVDLRDVITGQAQVSHARPRVFSSTGMSWEDIVTARVAFEAITVAEAVN